MPRNQPAACSSEKLEGKWPVCLLVAAGQRFEVGDIFIDLQSPQMGGGVGAHGGVFCGLVGGAPHHPRHLLIARVLRHLSRENGQKGMSIGHLASRGQIRRQRPA